MDVRVARHPAFSLLRASPLLSLKGYAVGCSRADNRLCNHTAAITHVSATDRGEDEKAEIGLKDRRSTQPYRAGCVVRKPSFIQ